MKYLITLLILFNVSCAPAKEQKQCGFYLSKDKQRITWQQNLPVKLYIDSSFPSNRIQDLKDSAAVWENIVGRTLFTFEGLVSEKVKFLKDGKNVIFMDNFSNPSMLGLTLIWSRADQITESDIQFSSKELDKATMTHELGHLLGLMHNEKEENSLMYPTFEEEQALTKTDIENIKCGYN